MSGRVRHELDVDYLRSCFPAFAEPAVAQTAFLDNAGGNDQKFGVLKRVAMGAVTRALAQLRDHGSAEPFLDQMQTRADLYDLIEYTPGEPWDFPAR